MKGKMIERPTYNERFGVMAAEARRNGSENLKVCPPQEVQWKPPLRQAATTLSVILGQCVSQPKILRKEKIFLR